MDVLASLQSLSSMAIWPVLMMNWRSILAYFPAAERFVDGLDVGVLIQLALGTRLGLLGLGLLSALALAHFTYAAWKMLRDLALVTCYTRYSINESTLLHGQVIDWINRNPRFHHVSTGLVTIKHDQDIEVPDSEEHIDIARMMNESKPFFWPEVDKISFWSGGSFFWVQKRKEKVLQYHGKEAPDNWIDIYCFNWRRSTKPLTELLASILREEAARNCDKTIIYKPESSWSPFDTKSRWGKTRPRLRRPLSTVILDQRQKDTIVDDVRSFLTQSGVQWYREKGLPLRLGYLFCGPPGTGKSSLAFSLASHFGLHVFMINLSSPGLNDADIESLFATLARRCIVLLEDVDATQPLARDLPPGGKRSGVGRDAAGAAADELDGSDEEETNTTALLAAQGLSGRGRRPGAAHVGGRGNAVTLSGLLNAIDGVAASEGRILIMTTNDIKNLDEALIRTGRADRIITFTNATKKQAGDMFINAYTGTRWGQHMSRETRLRHPEMEEWTDEEIRELADEFSRKIHDAEFSPALIQQYFKDFRAEPRRAVRELEGWMRDPRGYRKPSLDHDTDTLMADLEAKRREGLAESLDTPPTTPEE